MTANGKRRKLTRLDLMVISNSNHAAQGNAKALSAMLALMKFAGLGASEPEPAAATPLSADDKALIDRALAALQNGSDADSGDNNE